MIKKEKCTNQTTSALERASPGFILLQGDVTFLAK
tara:strand:+ start:523 stop:627 length:105 start_codon:yes stop_codon:yes gene_type:complete